MDADLRAAADAWAAEDPDPHTRAQLRGLLDAGDTEAVAAAFGAPLTFGTAGIRGPLGPGPAAMNRSVVRRVTAGVAARLAREPGAYEAGVVVGCDRRHRSEAFALDVLAVLLAHGVNVRPFARPGVPTPLVAFATRHCDAAAGIQITASHNPSTDNGYKVYWSDGAQIAEPLDTEIADEIAAIDALSDIDIHHGGRFRAIDREVRPAYVDAALALHTATSRNLRIAYTPLHGVGRDVTLEVLAAAGFTDVHVVGAQGDPDPDFPTVAFPNPEEPGALDLLLDLATEVQADIALAQDPDADRICAAVPEADGSWRVLTGDEVGCVLAEHLLTDWAPTGRRTVATTVVSSRLLDAVAAHHGVASVRTLTGFKWLAQEAEAARAAGGRMVLAYEQALGVMAGDAVRDKDGITGALVLAELAATRKAAGSSLLDAVDELARRHGLHLTGARSVRLDGPDGDELVARALGALRDEPPQALGGLPVEAVEDREARTSTATDGTVTPLDTPSTPLLGFRLAGGASVQLRPSGTEPLLKAYAEVVEPVADREPVAEATERARPHLDKLLDDLFDAAGLTGE